MGLMARPPTMMPAPSWRKTGRFVSSQVDLEGDRKLRAGGVRSGVEAEAPMAEGLDDLEAEGTERHVHAVVAQLLVGPHGGVAAAHIDDGEGLRSAQVRIES